MNKSYLICVKETQKAINLMTVLKKIKIAHQRLTGQIVLSGNELALNATRDKFGNITADNYYNQLAKDSKGKKSGKESEPYWILAQDWSTCSLKCGGGTMTLHRICVRPNGEGSCKGSDTITRVCNTDPCPGITDVTNKENNKIKTAKPIVRVLPFSKRYQSYTVSIKILNKYLNIIYLN